MELLKVNCNWQIKMRTLSDSAKFLFNNHIMSDIKFVFIQKDKTQIIYAHSWLLSLLSPVFYEVYKDNFERQKEIPIKHIPYNSFLECLRFLYTTECNFTEENVFDVMKIAKKYSLEFLEQDCAEYISKLNTIELTCFHLDKSITGDHIPLTDQLISFIKLNIKPVLQSNSFLNIKKESLKAILSINESVPISEVDIFTSVMKWAANKCEENKQTITGANKRQHLGDLVKLIRFATMSTNELGKCIAEEKGLLKPDETYALLMSISSKKVNTFGFKYEARQQIIDFDKLVEKKFNITGDSKWELKTEATVHSSKFTVNRIIYITGICIARSKLKLGATIKILNDQKIILHEEQLDVDYYKAYKTLSKPVFIYPNRIFTLHINYEPEIITSFFLGEPKIIPWINTQNGIEVEFSELSRFFRRFNFKYFE